MTLADVKDFLAQASEQERMALLTALRSDYGMVLHPLETKWGTTAEVVMEAIDQSSDLTQRGIRGILAEATFRTGVVPQWAPRWQASPVANDEAYDVLVRDGIGEVRIQCKLQRRERGVPLLHKKQQGVYVVETQRTRNGTRLEATAGVVAEATSTATRPYRFGEFDVLAVCLQPSTGSWHDFIFCACRDLAPRPGSPHLLAVMQPIQMQGSEKWSRDFDAVVERMRNTLTATPAA